MRGVRVWRRLAGVDDRTVVEDVDYDEDTDAVVVSVRPRRPKRRRCGVCERRSPGYDQGDGRRRWRGLDAGTVKVWLDADAPTLAYHLRRRSPSTPMTRALTTDVVTV